MNTNTGVQKMTKQYHKDANVNLAINSILINKELTSQFLNADMFVKDRWINGIQSVFNLSKSDAKIVADITFKEFYYGECA